ncbi:3-phytase B precursor [Didymella exigua CBS 183.55]|uniref:Phytase A n=1 Tax=Didymella exigua CBS 183.55 TaxID=1150837 RepID=A0A6A5R809_9PLEO|nr:3-phytase B precursor [Didymella exigua CBS 183.55]KAF1923449.1 3-phytase B precursor [Didymella exigua CBS 183.55]
MPVSMYATLLTAIVLNVNAVKSSGSCDSVDAGYRCDSPTSHFWGQYSPWFAVPSEIGLAPPQDCEVTFANVLSRHGGRDPTQAKTTTYHSLITGIQQNATGFPGDYEFLEHYNYTLGADDLTDFGRQEMVNSGAHFTRRYEKLLHKHKPFVRSSGQGRVVESAQKWLTGVAQSLKTQTRAVDVIIPEATTSNNTLSHDTCPAFETGAYSDLGAAAQKAWSSKFVPPIQKRINGALGLNLTTSSIINLMDMCPYDTLASPNSTLSDFCHLFAEAEWHAYDYYQTLGKFFGYGAGNPLGATQGVGYVNELLARLTGKPVVDHTNTNTTLDAHPATFPLHNKVYADFSHDNDMSGVFAALGLYNTTKLSNGTVKSAQETGFSAAWTVPFAARMYVEKLRCKHDKEEFVRVVVNDRVHPLKFCGGDELGRCTLARFVESQGFARSGGGWERCYV